MSLEQLRKNRLDWVETNRRNRFEAGIKNLLTQLYPDNAHFIYELLQNSEDTRASLVRFTLTNDSLDFEHNGERLFSLPDVESITGIGDSTKSDDPTSIGKFGVGFKAVFAYTSTPEIHSGEFHFRIHDLVVPETNDVKQQHIGERETRFIFPFDHPKKSSQQATAEIELGLRTLGDNTLLFLSHIRKIEYRLPDNSRGSLERIDHENGHIEIRVCHPGGDDTVSHWLYFQKDIEVLDEDGEHKTCRGAIAYSLVEEDDKKKSRSEWKIVPLDHGQVSIYFPAEKETSNLRFHLHAPFASTVARDSVRVCKANDQLRDRLAGLVVDSLASIRDQGMLTVGFLSLLPNPADNLPPFYEPIRKAIVHAFQKQSLTPMKYGGHAAADGIFRGPANISDLLNDYELIVLLGPEEYVPPMWAANPYQKNQREDRFIESLKIDEWGWSEMAHLISHLDDQKLERIENWISNKNDTWLMRLYSLLGEAPLEYQSDLYVEIQWLGGGTSGVGGLRALRIVRIETEQGTKHVKPGEAFFPPDDEISRPPGISFVKPAVYNTGRSEAQKKSAASFLEHIGVRPFDAKAVIGLRLTQYKSPPNKIADSHYNDLKEFIAYWKKNPTEANLFRNYKFLIGFSPDGGLRWRMPTGLCLDNPYVETGLSEFTEIHGKNAIWNGYKDKLSVSQLKDFTSLLQAIGIMYKLEVELARTYDNPHALELRKDYNSYGTKWTYTGIDKDYSISNIVKYLNTKTITASRLIWNALINADAESAMAHFRPNQQYTIREADSQLVYHLKRHAWIPIKSGEFRKPEDMTTEDLRKDFPYDERNGLLTAIGFGKNSKMRSEEYIARNQHAQNIGFASADVAEKYAEFDKLITGKGMSIDELIAQFKPDVNKGKPAFPTRAISNRERRQERLLEQLDDAPEKEYEQRENSIRTTRGTIDPVLWLRNQYLNEENQMICQICKQEMPFRKRDGEYYFEAVEAFSIEHFAKEHEVQFLALCPLCAAMYKEFVKRDEDAMETIKNALMNSNDPEISLQLGVLNTSIRFVESHWQDIRTILQEY